MGFKNYKSMAFALAGLFVLTGTYNAVVINSESQLSGSEIKFVKRLDEVYGVTVAGREVAASVQWQKLTPTQIAKVNPIIQTVSKIDSASSAPVAAEATPAAAVQEELTLSLVEVINQKKWQNGLPAGQFNGSLSTNNGVIENLAVALPNGEGVSVSFSEMTGNVFEYDLNGELYSGMMYQVDQHAYMVTLTNGPLEGTRLRFSSQSPADEQAQTQEALAESNIEVGNFGQEPEVTPQVEVQPEQTVQAQELSPEQLVQNDQRMQLEAEQAQSFNLDQSQAM